MYKILKKLFSRIFILGLSAILQVLWVVGFVYLLNSRYRFLSLVIQIFCMIAVLWIVNKRINPSYKLALAVLILSFPLIGAALYLLFGQSRLAYQMGETTQNAAFICRPLLDETPAYRNSIELIDPLANKQSVYLRDYAGFPVYKNTSTEYYPVGEMLYESMIRELRRAKHFIFLEYFIIDNGEMWGSILDILEEKVREGVDVRLIYDDVGCVSTLPGKFYEKIRQRGIQCEVFNRFRPIISIAFNNRDHRKIMVIDGYIGFTGGINLADEYINKKVRFGHWKDTGVMLKGEAVWSFTVMFLQMWHVIRNDMDVLMDEIGNASMYGVRSHYSGSFENDGFVHPYGDNPVDNETVGENVYLNMINQAKRYVYIFTPYLIIDNEMMTALCLAAKSGIDIRIMVPGIPDKKMVYLLTQSYYAQLIDSGVRIYEYAPGFLHAKCFLCDDEIATVGTINLDYRSLYLHFECGVWMYRSRAVMQLKDDMLDTLRDSREVTREDCQRNVLVRLGQSILRLMAPLL